MGNHVHLIAIPPRESALARAVGGTHVDYARWLNLRRGETGHVWQNRFFSCPMDERHGWEALRYVEQNPVRGGQVRDAPAWPWSSAAAHTTGVDRSGIVDMAVWERCWSGPAWHEVLAAGTEDAALRDHIREATRTGRPAGGEEFVRQLEASRDRWLRPRTRGPKVKPAGDERQMSLYE